MNIWKLLPAAIVFWVSSLTAQPLYLSVSGGVAGYSGDLQATRYNPHNTHITLGANLKYKMSPHWTIRMGYNYAYLSASDLNNDPQLRFRNLSFSTKLHEGNLLLEYDLVSDENSRLIPYMMAGVGVFHFNPYYLDAASNKVYLHPLGTEGQYLSTPKNKPYKLIQTAMISGGGIKFSLSEQVTISYEIGVRKLSTDYLDDVSTFYYLPADASNKYLMAYKEIGTAYADRYTEMRGNPFSNDLYYFSSLGVTIGLEQIRNTKTYRYRYGDPWHR